MSGTNVDFAIDAIEFMQTAPTKVLLSAVNGRIDLNRLANEEIASRGLDPCGQWVGFEEARKQAQITNLAALA